MRLLGLDTATAACSVALWSDDRVVARRRVDAGKRHAEILVPLIDEIVGSVGAALPAIDAFAVTIGPGSFTGIRVGLATARGLALATGRPLIGISTLEVLAADVPEQDRVGRILATIDARRGRLYAQCFDDALQPVGEPAAIGAAELPGFLPEPRERPVLVVGSGTAVALDALAGVVDAREGPPLTMPDAGTLVRLAAYRAGNASFDAAVTPRPLYLRDTGARVPGAGRK